MTCSTEEIHLGDIGTIFEITLKDCDEVVDLSGATSKLIIFKKPDKIVVTQTASFSTDGTDGIIQYATVLDDLDQTGFWYIQANVTLPSGTWSSEITRFKVYKNL